MLQALLTALGLLGRGMAAGAGRFAAGMGSMGAAAARGAFGMGGGGRYAMLRNMVSARKMFGGALARGALAGGARGAASRLGLAWMANRRAKKRGQRLPSSVFGFVARDIATLGSSLGGLTGSIRTLSERMGGGGLSRFSPVFAEGEAQLERGRLERAGRFARDVATSEAYANRAQNRLEESLLPVEENINNLKNFALGAGKNILSALIDVGTIPWKAAEKIGEFIGNPDVKINEMTPEQRAARAKKLQDDFTRPDWWAGERPDTNDVVADALRRSAAGQFHTSQIAAQAHANHKDVTPEDIYGRMKPPLPPMNGPAWQQGQSRFP